MHQQSEPDQKTWNGQLTNCSNSRQQITYQKNNPNHIVLSGFKLRNSDSQQITYLLGSAGSFFFTLTAISLDIQIIK